MPRSFARALSLSGVFLGSVALAQQPSPPRPLPRIASVFPAGAKAGTAVDVTVNGTDLDAEEGEIALLFSHPGIKAEYTAPPEPKDAKDAKADDKKKPPAEMKKRKGPPPTAVKFKVTVAADVPAAAHDVRVSTRLGVSNPRSFTVGTLTEVEEKEPNNDVPEAQKVEVGTVVNGVISSATDVDYTAFAGKAGQRVLLHCAASSIDSRAHPLLELFAPDGRRIAANRNYSGSDALLDATLPTDGDYLVRLTEFAYTAGGPDYFYRLTLGTGPWVDAVFPPVVNPGKPTPVTVYGRNLPGGKSSPTAVDGRPVETAAATVTPPTDPSDRTKFAFPGRVPPVLGLADGFAFRLTPAANPVPVFLTDAAVVLESDQSNDTPDTAQTIPAPCDVAGRIEKRNDRDFYKFPAKKGDVLTIELFAGRLGADVDAYFSVRTAKNEPVGEEQDDDPDVLHPVAFHNRSGDPAAFKFTAPSDGDYLVLVGTRESNVAFGPRCTYRLRVAKPAPDFRAVVMPRSRDLPAAAVVPAEGDAAFDVFVNRTDGFTGPITATVEGLPSGVTATPALIGTGAKWGTLVVTAADGAKDFTGPVTVKCTAEIDGKPTTRAARPASVAWGVPGQNNNNTTPLISRLDRQLVLAVRPESKATFRIAADPKGAKVASKGKDGKATETAAELPLSVKPGDKITLPVKVTWHDKEPRANPVNVILEPTTGGERGGGNKGGPMTMNNGQPVAVPKEKDDATITIDVKSDAAPGVYAVVLRGETMIQLVRDPAAKDKKTPATAAAYAAPLTVTVLPPPAK